MNVGRQNKSRLCVATISGRLLFLVFCSASRNWAHALVPPDCLWILIKPQDLLLKTLSFGGGRDGQVTFQGGDQSGSVDLSFLQWFAVICLGLLYSLLLSLSAGLAHQLMSTSAAAFKWTARHRFPFMLWCSADSQLIRCFADVTTT